MASASKNMKRFRVTMGLCVALIGAIALDEVVFKKDIDHQIEINKESFADIRAKEEEARFDKINEMPDKKKAIENGEISIRNAEEKALDEMDGKGSGVRGAGKITSQKLAIAERRKSVNSLKQKAYDSLLAAKSVAAANAREKAKQDYGDGLIIRLQALFQLVSSTWEMRIAYAVFTILMFCLEFIVVLVKSNTPETNYERKLRLIEEIGEKRMAILSGNESPLIHPDRLLPNALSARQSIAKKHSIFN
jgi:hypothetical protein